MKKLIVIFLATLFLNNCCWMAKRDCFPPCPPQEVITVEKFCTLPPPIQLDDIKFSIENCPTNYTCFDVENYSKLAKRLSDMRLWIQEARERCGKKENTVPTKPTDGGIGTKSDATTK